MFQIANKLGKKNINAKIYQHDVIVNFFDVAAFLFSILITGLGFMPILLLIVELWHYLFVRDW